MVPLSNTRSKNSAPARKRLRAHRPGTPDSRSGERRVTRSRQRTLQRRFAILRAAGIAFRRHGFARTGMRQIAREAGLSPPNLYYYFRGKDELLAFCQNHALDRMLSALRSIRRSRGSAAAKLERVIRAQVLCMLDDLGGAAAHLQVDALPRHVRSRIVRKRDRYERELRGLIEVGVRGGSLSTTDPTLAVRAILGAVNWSAHWYDPAGPQTPTEIADRFADFLVQGLHRRNHGGKRD